MTEMFLPQVKARHYSRTVNMACACEYQLIIVAFFTGSGHCLRPVHGTVHCPYETEPNSTSACMCLIGVHCSHSWSSVRFLKSNNSAIFQKIFFFFCLSSKQFFTYPMKKRKALVRRRHKLKYLGSAVQAWEGVLGAPCTTA